jgi:ABC-2 type transport system permease protein
VTVSTGRTGAIWKIAACDFRLTMKEKSAVLWIFLMPLAFITFFGLSFGGGSERRPLATLTVEDNDGGYLAGDLISLLAGENYYIQMSDTMPEDRDPVRTLVIPAGFTEKVLGRERVDLTLVRERGSNDEAGRAASAAVFRSLARLVTGLIEIENGLIEEGSERIAVRGDTLYGSLLLVSGGGEDMTEWIEERIDTLLVRPANITVRSRLAGKGMETPGGFQSSVPGSLVMFVLMSMLFSGAVITAERKSGVLRRIGMSSAGKADVVAGKLLGRIFIAAAQIIFLLAAGRLIFGISLGGSPGGLMLLMLAFAFAMGSLSILFGSLLSDPDQVTTVGVITALAMAALGGCWWPLEVVSRPLRIVAYCLPTGWTINGIHRLISFGMGASEVAPHITMLALFGLVFLAVGARRLKWDA